MDAMQISEYAHALYRAHGDSAEFEAARRSQEKEAEGKIDEARSWRSVQAAVRQLRGPGQS
ncbi:hypothetical protein [Salipiger mucosus]|uniref:Uncharacterized protein n=1 Tax=Salipiger mucosus DSM 16094 TaxID=1123237 RepID=S9QDY6_9RHOB|nr:hypothetical protein [Salipiger mucosus]EPX79636.1 hypothetical protein Salmuc_05576 [Salipiger mucosus DSM 16094]